MALICRDIEIGQGVDYSFGFRILRRDRVPVDWSGSSVRMQVRESFASTTPYLDIGVTHGSSGCDSGGRVWGRCSAAATRGLPAPKRCVYDVEVTSADGTVTRLASGVARISPEVTRS